MSSIVTTAEYNRFYIIVYVFSQYIFVYIQLDTLNINLYIHSELSIVHMQGTVFLGGFIIH